MSDQDEFSHVHVNATHMAAFYIYSTLALPTY